MERDRIKLLACTLRRADRFDAEKWFHECGTPACMAGYACFLARDWPVDGKVDPDMLEEEFADPHVVAREWLGLSNLEATVLFHPPNYIRKRVTGGDAADALESLLDAGYPTWMQVIERSWTKEPK